MRSPRVEALAFSTAAGNATRTAISAVLSVLATLALAVPASPAAASPAPGAPDGMVIYTLPYPAVSSARTAKSAATHTTATVGRAAIDVANAGEPFAVIAARGGVVRTVRDDSEASCTDLSCWAEANFVLVDHGDGTSALYLHLASGEVRVADGDRVTRGQELGVAGSTGFSTGTHLHFQVQRTPCLTAACRSRPGWWWGRALEVAFDDADDAAPARSTPDGGDTGPVAAPAPDWDWRNRSYTFMCRDLTTRPVTVRVRGGHGLAPGDRNSPQGYQVFVSAVETGDLTGDARPETAVLLFCGAWGANFSMPVVLVYRHHTLLGQLPLLEPLYGGMRSEVLGFEIRDGELATKVGYYAPGDAHVSGPSIAVTLLWHWDGNRFTTTLPVGPRCRSGVDSVAVGGVCLEIPAGWLSVRDVSTWLGADWTHLFPPLECHLAHRCLGFQLLTGVSYDRRLAGNGQERGFDADTDTGWWTGPGTPECLTDQLADNPVQSSQLTVSGTRPFGVEQADYRQWTLTCQHGGPQEVRAWILPGTRRLVLTGPLPAALQQQVTTLVEAATFS